MSELPIKQLFDDSGDFIPQGHAKAVVTSDGTIVDDEILALKKSRIDVDFAIKEIDNKVKELTGLEGAKFIGIYTNALDSTSEQQAIDYYDSLVEEDKLKEGNIVWFLYGSSLDNLKLASYDGNVDSEVTKYESNTYDFTDFSNIKEQVNKNTTDLTDLALKVGGKIVIPTTESDKYINVSGGVGTIAPLSSPTSSTTGYRYMLQPVEEGDIVTINGVGGSSARLWSFLDADYKILSISDAGAIGSDLEKVAPSGAAYVIINDNSGATSYIEKASSLFVSKANKKDTDILARKVDDVNNEIFSPVAKNVLDLSTVKTGYYINYAYGFEAALSGYTCSDFIPVKYGDKIMFCGISGSIAYYFYKENKASKGGYAGVSSASIANTVIEVTKKDVAYIRVSGKFQQTSMVLVSNLSFVAPSGYVNFNDTVGGDSYIKKIVNNVDELKKDSDAYKEAIYEPTIDNLLDVSNLINDTYINQANGTQSVDSTYHRKSSGFIQVNPGDYLLLHSFGNYITYVFYDSAQNYITGKLNAENESKLVAPENAAYIRVSCVGLEYASILRSNSDFDTPIEVPDFGNFVGGGSRIITLEKDINTLNEDVSSVKTSVFGISLENLLDTSVIRQNVWVNYSNGGYQTLSGKKTSDYIPVTPGNIIKFVNLAGDIAYCWYLADKKSAKSGAFKYGNELNEIAIVVPNGVNYLVVSAGYMKEGESMVVSAQKDFAIPEEFIPYGNETTPVSKIELIDKGFTELKKNYEDYKGEILSLINEANPFFSSPKKWFAIGDSFTEINDLLYATGYRLKKGYMTRVCSKIPNLEYTNAGHSGAGMSSGLNVLTDEVLQTGYDLFTVLFGTNDWWRNTSLGTKTDFDNQTTSTILGSLGAIISRIRNNSPKSKIIVMTPTHRGVYMNVSNTKVESYDSYKANKKGVYIEDIANGIIECCKSVGVPVVDLFRDSQITPYNAMKFAKVSVDGELRDLPYPDYLDYIDYENETSPHIYPANAVWTLYDGLHPSDVGMEIIARLLAKEIIKVFTT